MLKLRELRQNKGLSQTELAKILGVTYFSVGDWERNRCQPSIEILIKLSEIFNVSIDYLVGREDDFGNVATKSNVTEKEARLLKAFSTLSDLEQDKLIADAEFYSLRHLSKIRQ